ncbi:MAG: GNAT family N-acetyltransferase [Spirosomataceae bacterium]|jgi:ribosomal protein S18 acetylase RimI-like enzyme
MIEFEIIDKANLGRIREIAYQTWPEAYKNVIATEQIDYMLKMMYDNHPLEIQLQAGHILIILKEDGKDMGFVAFEKNYEDSGSTKIHKLYVLPECQGKGFGKNLVEKVIREIADFNQKSLILNVNKKNPSLNFYEKIGFIKAREIVIDIGNGFLMDDYIMELSI